MRRIASIEKYLFAAEATINDVVEHQRRHLKQRLEEIGTQTILENTVEELTNQIAEEFRLEIPKLDRDRVRQLPNEEIDIDVSQDPMRGIFDRSQPFYIKGTMLRIAVPFSGYPDLFKYGSSPYNSPIPGEIEATDLILTHRAEKPDVTRVKQDFDHRLSQIQAMLEMITGPAEEWNRQLSGTIRTRLEERRAKIEHDQTLNLGYSATILQPPPASPRPSKRASGHNPGKPAIIGKYDLFLSHAHEDKNAIARPLYLALAREGISVWFDEAVLRMGDSLRRKIDEGLARCRYGVVILSPTFLSKQWP
jgi:hypothetical protein